MTTIDDNKAIARRFLELVSNHDAANLCKIVSSAWKMHGGPPDLPLGPDGIHQLFDAIGPIEQKWTIKDTIAEADKVVVRAINTCRQESFFGVPADGREQQFTATFIHQISEGKIVETWRNADDLGRLLQLGARIESSVTNRRITSHEVKD
jgi:ketosteroid isomerase-like protein